MADNDFSSYLAQRLPAIEQCVMDHVPTPVHAGEQDADLNRYLYEPVASFIQTGGKRIRPALCLLGAEAVGADPEACYPVSASVELFQAAALIHDDIADKSELRRSVPCMYITEGMGLAVNAGDSALVAVTASVLRDERYDPAVRLRLLDEIVAMEEHTLEGQALDLGWARDGRWDISVEDYLAMARRKTAYYSAAVPLAMGAICGGGTNEQVEGLRSFGMDCGLAFQIQDDLLNLVGDAGKQGKDFRSDITEGKRTLVMVWALEHLDAPGREELVRILSSGTVDMADLSRAVELAEQAGAVDHARTFALELTERAKVELDRIGIAEEPRHVLRSMAEFFVSRAS